MNKSEGTLILYRWMALTFVATIAIGPIATSHAAPVVAPSAPGLPDALRAPAGQVLALELLAEGVQIYECASAGEGAARYEWKFKAPQARLMDRSGRPMGTHYGGPTWEAPDGSVVVAEVKARANAAEPAAIPLLLLAAKATNGNGMFTRVRSIQRLDTLGGLAPAEPCTRAAQVARVPYTATYYFYVDPAR